MTPFVFGLLVAAAVMHAGWNLVAKASADRLVGLLLMKIVAAILMLPVLLVFGLPNSEAWVWLASSSLIHVTYLFALAEAYERVDMSVAYPIIRGTAPVVVTAVSLTPIVGDTVAPLGLIGIGLVASAVLSLASRTDKVGLAVAVGAGLCIAAYTTVDGLGVRTGEETFRNAIVYTACVFTIQAVLSTTVVLKLRGLSVIVEQAKRAGVSLIFAGVASSLGYLFATYASQTAPLGLVSGLRETSSVFGALFSVIFLKENVSKRRWVSIVAALVGIICIASVAA